MFILGSLISLIIIGSTLALIRGAPLPQVLVGLTIIGMLMALAGLYLAWAAWVDRQDKREP